MMRPLTFLLPVLYAIFLWWFTTGLVIVVYGRSSRLIRFWFVGATAAMLMALATVLGTRHLAEPVHVYVAVTAGLIVWGWQTAAYYLGFITGPPAQQPLAHEKLARPNEWRGFAYRFRRALRASLYHEVTAAAFFFLLAWLTHNQPNRWGFWIFTAVWLMHLSAKVNVFLGVRNFHIEFLPAHLHHLGPLLHKQQHNPFLPISVVLASAVALTLVYRAIVPGTPPADTAGYLLIATMLGLAVLEHLLLVLPLPAMLWGWSLKPLPDAVRDDQKTRTRPHSPIRGLPKQMSES